MTPVPDRAAREFTKGITPVPRRRRSEDDRIEDLRRKIAKLEERKAKSAAKHDPVVREGTKLLRALKKGEAVFVSDGRQDLANSAKAAAISLRGILAATRLPR